MSTVDSIFSIVIFHVRMSLFQSTLLSFCKPFLLSFFLCYPGEAFKGPILTGVCKNLTMLNQITIYNMKNYYTIWKYIYICVCVCIYMCMYMCMYNCECCIMSCIAIMWLRFQCRSFFQYCFPVINYIVTYYIYIIFLV